MASLELRVKRLEEVQKATKRIMSDVELAVRIAWMLESKAPGCERVLEILSRHDADEAPRIHAGQTSDPVQGLRSPLPVQVQAP